ncbi:hypothetical protein BJV82DRAFT_607571 [Fennellomyces sp. T-0311]|nr:hypothetical protein BJV82DRAFT_607571 [Fennellomyces sp. T-0311]
MLFFDLLLFALVVLVTIHPSFLSSLPADKHQPRDVITNSVYIGLVALRVIVYVAVTLIVAVLNTDASYVGVLSPIMQKPQGSASNSAPTKLIDTLTIAKDSSTKQPVDETVEPKAAVETNETVAPVKEPEPIIEPEQTIDTALETIVPKEETIAPKEEVKEAAVIEPPIVVKKTPLPIVPRDEPAKESIASPVSQATTASETTQDVNTNPVPSSDKSAASIHSNNSHVDSSEEHSDDTEMTSDASETSKQPSAKPSMTEVVALDDAPATSAASSVHTATSNGSRLARLAGKVTGTTQQPKPHEPQPSQSKQRRSIIPLRTSSLMRRDRQAPKPDSEGQPAVHKTLSMRLPKAANIFHHNNHQNETTKAPRPFFTLGRRSKVPEPPTDEDNSVKPKPKSRLTPRKRISNLFHQQ